MLLICSYFCTIPSERTRIKLTYECVGVSMLVSEVVCISGAKLSGAEDAFYSFYCILVRTDAMESHINIVSARACSNEIT